MQTPTAKELNGAEVVEVPCYGPSQIRPNDNQDCSNGNSDAVRDLSASDFATYQPENQNATCGKPPIFPEVEAGQRVLYIGAGADTDYRALVECVRPTGLVVSLISTQSILSASNKGLTFLVVSPTTSLPFRNNTMDWVISTRPVSMAAENEADVCELMRILKPGGRISAPVMLAHTDFGNLWSPRLEAIKIYDSSVAEDVVIEPAKAEDVRYIQELLRRENLPTDVKPHLSYYVVARHLGRVIGCSGMEVHGAYAVLRSLTVDLAYRRSNLSQRLLAARNQMALQHGVTRGYMLTTTIAPMVEAWGYRRIDRSQVPPMILETSEFRSDRCASATVLYWDFAPCSSEEE